MNKNITILRGSPKKNGNTNTLSLIVEKALTDSGYALHIHDLYDMDIRPCLACIHCQKDWENPSCIQQDDMPVIFDSVLKSDLIILATPIYSWYCTAPMKASLDRMVYAFNKYYGEEKGPSLWENKKVALITTCGYPPERGVDLFEEGMKRYCKHSKLKYVGMLCERHPEDLNLYLKDDESKQRIQAYIQMIQNTMEQDI